MTSDHQHEHGAEIVPLHPVPEPGPDPLHAVPAETSYEIELDSPEQPAPAAPLYVDLTSDPGTRLPVIPPHWRGRAAIRVGRRADEQGVVRWLIASVAPGMAPSGIDRAFSGFGKGR